jgi:hypothetical protein
VVKYLKRKRKSDGYAVNAVLYTKARMPRKNAPLATTRKPISKKWLRIIKKKEAAHRDSLFFLWF